MRMGDAEVLVSFYRRSALARPQCLVDQNVNYLITIGLIPTYALIPSRVDRPMLINCIMVIWPATYMIAIVNNEISADG